MSSIEYILILLGEEFLGGLTMILRKLEMAKRGLVHGDESSPVSLTQVSKSADEIENHDQLASWVRGPLRQHLPHQHAVLAFGGVHSLGITIEETLCVDLPESYIAGIRNPAGHINSPELSRWQAERDLQYFDLESIPHDIYKCWVENFRHHRLYNGVVDGHVDSTSNTVAFLTLFNIAPAVQHSGIALGVREVHAAWLRIRHKKKEKLRHTLTPAELEVLKWVRLGKSNGEIAQILEKNMLTVRNQVQNLLKKTRTINRTQLAQVNF